MTYTVTEIAWFFFLYSFVGWVGEVCAAAIQKRKFVNRGFVNGPLCPIYGVASTLFLVFLPDLTDKPFFLFLGGMVLATVLEYCTGKLLEKIFHQRLWDYSRFRFHLDGYICLRRSLLWGLLALLLMLFVNPLLARFFSFLPGFFSTIVLWSLSFLLLTDFISTAVAVLGMQKEADRLAQLTERFQKTSCFLENALTRKIQSRMVKSFPAIDLNELAKARKEERRRKKTSRVFAEGCSFYKLVCLFFIGALLGDLVETIFCLLTAKRLMSRSSVVYGPFSIVWGLGCVILTALLYRFREKSKGFIFLLGTVLGGVYEYICSVFTERVFGTVFWDYSKVAFNLGGRINLLFCLFWGIASVVWLKHVYPFLSRWIEKLPVRLGKILCNVLIVFMIFDIAISGLALGRYMERQEEASRTQAGVEENGTETGDAQENVSPGTETPLWLAGLRDWLDEHFDDQRMERIYPNMKIVGEDGVAVYPDKLRSLPQ